MVAPAGAKRFLADLPALLEAKESALPPRLRSTLLALWEEVRELEGRIEGVQSEMKEVTRQIPVLQALLEIPGVGVLTATAARLACSVTRRPAWFWAVWHHERSFDGDYLPRAA